ALRAALAGRHVLIADVSANRVTLELSGPKAREVIAKGCGLDLHSRAFRPGQCAQTVLARSQAVIWQIDEAPTYRLLVRPSFAGYVADFLIDAMREYTLPAIPHCRQSSAIRSCQSSGRSRTKRAISAMHAGSSISTTSTPRSTSRSAAPRNFSISPTATRGISNCSTAPEHMKHGLSVV